VPRDAGDGGHAGGDGGHAGPGAATPPAGRAAVDEWDVLVYGATAGGVMAAVAAAQRGARVLLAEPGQHIGGMTSGGLGYTDVGDRRVIGGLSARFYQAVAQHYGVSGWHYAGPEPHVAEQLLTGWLDRAGVSVRLGAGLSELATRAGVIGRVALADRSAHRAAVYVDACYEGDLLAAAGVSYHVGRENRSRYGELLAGRAEIAPGRHNFDVVISPFASPAAHYPGTPDQPADDLLPLLHDRALAPVGSGDGGVMAYGYRVCLTTAADRVPIGRRPGYDESEFELVRRYLAAMASAGREVRAGQMVGLEPNLPGGKCDGNSLGPISLNLLDGTNWHYPEAAPAERERIRLRHLNYTHDLLYFFSHDRAVPAAVRTELSRWGLPSDEFSDTGGWPHQLYVREARRMLGEYVLTENDLLRPAGPVPDAVAMGSYHIDIREVQRTWRWLFEHPEPMAQTVNEGYLSVPVRPYPVPYRCLLPRRAECTNLLVPVCASASHVAFASLRMEVQYQMLGAAAGVAAALAVRTGRAVHDIAVTALQAELAADGQVLAL
jgi:hypothetical protein